MVAASLMLSLFALVLSTYALAVCRRTRAGIDALRVARAQAVLDLQYERKPKGHTGWHRNG